MKTVLLATGAALALSVSSASAAFIGIDNFDDTTTTLLERNTAGISSAAILTGANAIGGEREVILTFSASSIGPGSSKAKVSIGGPGGALDGTLAVSNDPIIISTVELLYDGIGTGDLNANLSAHDGFVMSFFADLPLQFDVIFRSAGVLSSVQTYNVPPGISVSQVPFTDFANLTTSDIDAIRILFRPAAAGDFLVDLPLGTPEVPEPATLGLLGLGALALLRRKH